MKLQNTVIHKSYIYGLFFVLIQAIFFTTIILSRNNLNEDFLLILMIVLNILYILITFGLIFLYLKNENQKEIIKKMEEFILSLPKTKT